MGSSPLLVMATSISRKIHRGLRLWARRLHLWLAVGIGVLATAIAVSGTLLVYRAEIDAALQPTLEWDGRTVSPWESVVARATAARPEGTLMMLWFPTEARPYYESAYLLDGVEYTGELRFHPATGELIEFVSLGWLHAIEAFHENLLLGEFGAFLVEWSTFFFGLVVLTGLYLWWPGWRLQRWIEIRPGRRLVFDTHRVLGFLAAPFLLLMVATGLVMVWPKVAEPVIYRLAFERPPETAGQELWRLQSVLPPGEPRDAPSRQLLEDALARAPEGSFPYFLTFPIFPTEARQVRLQHTTRPPPGGATYVYYYDRYSGDLLGADTPNASRAASFLGRWNDALHFGTFLGGWSQAVWALSSGATLYFLVTGFLLWWRRTRGARSEAPRKVGD
jgi:uncharacterized iron-regulated membrane protein